MSPEVPEDDPADLHALPGVPHPAERGAGRQSRTPGSASLNQNQNPSFVINYFVFSLFVVWSKISWMENESKFTHNALGPSDFTDQSEPTRCKRDDATGNEEIE